MTDVLVVCRALLANLPGVQELTALMPASIQFAELGKVAAQSGGGIGDCAGA